MATLCIKATFPLGTYLGHHGAHQRSPRPDTARLHAGLTHAAGTGSTAIEVDGDLRPNPDAVAALDWLERNAPTAIELPASTYVATRSALSWRAEGVFNEKKMPKKELKRQSDAVALAGPIGWAWAQDAPASVVATIDALCADVSCLGEGESLVVLEVAEIEPTHFGGTTVNPLSARTPGEVRLDTPSVGRGQELDDAYLMARPAKPPTIAQDRFGMSQRPEAPAIRRGAVHQRAYQPIVPVRDAPWTTALMVSTSQSIDPADRVQWCVSLHRALCSVLGPEATSVTTGKYPAGERPPANRLAIHLVPDPQAEDRTGFAVLFPPEASEAERRSIERACRRLRELRRTSRDVVRVIGVTEFDPLTFWPTPGNHSIRLWRPTPGLVPDFRRAPRTSEHHSLRTAALVAVGHLLRDRFPSSGSSDRFQHLAHQVELAGVRVGAVRRIPDAKVERYAHKTPRGVVVQPYDGWFDFGPLLDPRSLFALGQSRHLGGGLMNPVDVPHTFARELFDDAGQ